MPRSPMVEDRNLASAVGTSATTLLACPVRVTALYETVAAWTVITAATTLTVTVTWTDAAGTSQTVHLVDAVSEAVGAGSARLALTAQAGSTVTVTATAATADQVTASAALLALR